MSKHTLSVKANMTELTKCQCETAGFCPLLRRECDPVQGRSMHPVRHAECRDVDGYFQMFLGEAGKPCKHGPQPILLELVIPLYPEFGPLWGTHLLENSGTVWVSRTEENGLFRLDTTSGAKLEIFHHGKLLARYAAPEFNLPTLVVHLEHGDGFPGHLTLERFPAF